MLYIRIILSQEYTKIRIRSYNYVSLLVLHSQHIFNARFCRVVQSALIFVFSFFRSDHSYDISDRIAICEHCLTVKHPHLKCYQ
jgi:hypothetical protein